MVTTGQKLLLARKRLGLTQHAVGSEIGITPWTVRRIELGRNRPSAGNEAAINLWLYRHRIVFDERGNIGIEE